MSRFGLSPGVSFFIREKDIGFDLSGIKGYQRVRTDELILFAKEQLKLLPRDIRSVQVHPVGPYAFIGFNNVERMRDIYDGIKEGVMWPGKGEVFPFLCTESYTEVKLKGLEPGSDPIAVSLMMEDYGNVLSCKEYLARIPAMNTNEGFPTGDFSLRIQLSKKIPRYLPQAREGNVWLATYEGQEDECWRCWQPGHERRDCKSKPFAPDFMKDQRYFRDLYLKQEDEQVVEEVDLASSAQGAPPGQVAGQGDGLQAGDKAGSSPLGESSPPGQVASLKSVVQEGETRSASGEVPPGLVASQVVGVGVGKDEEKESDKAGSSPLGESSPPGQVASLVSVVQEGVTGSASGEVPPCLVASQVVGSDKSIDEEEDFYLKGLFPPGNTQDLNMAMDDYEKTIGNETEDPFEPGNTQVCLDALDRAEAGFSGTKPKTVRNRSWSSNETSPKRFLNKPLGLESDRRRGLKDWPTPRITPADRVALKNSAKKESTRN